MNLLDFIISLFSKKINTGVFPDTRSEEEKDNDVTHDEIAGGEVTWVEKDPSTWKKFTLRDQSSSYSCVLQSNAKARGVTEFNETGNFPVLSAREYNERSNYPTAGTIPYEGLQITSRGLALEFLYPSEKLTEDEINVRIPKAPQVIQSEQSFSGGTPVSFPSIDIDSIAQALDSGFGVVVCCAFYAKYWQYVVQVGLSSPNVHHQIAVVDRTIYNGKKALICEDSAFLGTSKDGQRILTEDALLKYCYFAGYVAKLKEASGPKPNHIFTADISFGMRSNEVTLLQKRLVYEGLLSSDCISGYFGPLTKQAVIAYQKKNGINPTGYCGPITRAKLNS